MKHLLITLLVINIGCGSSDQAATPKDTEKIEPTRLQSIAIADVADLPECDKRNETQLAYIKSDKEFYVCESADWVKLDDIPSTTEILKGQDGNNGNDGINGTNGSDGETITTNNWFDAVTGKLWLIGAIGSYAAAEGVCIDPWRLPTKDEALAATQRGLGVASNTIAGPSNLWTTTPWDSNPATNNWIIQNIHTTPALSAANWSTESKGIYCIEE